MTQLKSIEALRKIYALPKNRAITKELNHLEKHSRHFIELSPFLIIGTSSERGYGDVSPRGEAPGFVKILDDTSIAIPDRPGNNRLDTLSNIIENPKVGLIFLIPGFDETLRINGTAEIRDELHLLELFSINNKLPKTAIVVKINQVYLHCAKALIRSKLWQTEGHTNRSLLPTMNTMINEQTNNTDRIETEEETTRRNLKTLY